MRCLPEKGVLEEDGTPFYHVRQTYLRPDQLQRLKECGLFSPSWNFIRNPFCVLIFVHLSDIWSALW